MESTARSFDQPDGSSFSTTFEGKIQAVLRCRGCDFIVGFLAEALQTSMWEMRPAKLEELLTIFTVVGDGVEHRDLDNQCWNCHVKLNAGYIQMEKL